MNVNRGLKDYQERTLDVLDEFFKEIVKQNNVKLAYETLTEKYLDQAILYQNQDDYIDPTVAHVCLRVPTGGGKTLLGVNSIKIAIDNLNKPLNSVVIWLTPSKAILEQTIKALKNENSLYRKHLDKYFKDINILTVPESLNISKTQLDNHLTIIVATFQSFRVDDPEGRKVYSSSGDLMEHFTSLSAKQSEKLLKTENGQLSYSLSNLFNIRNPIIIVDEAHNARTELSFGFLKNLNPSFILELTATPEVKQYPLNVLYSVSAAELKSEKMLKIPMYVSTKSEWKELISDAISKRVELEEAGSREKSYVRPIMLIQAQPNRKNDPHAITIDVVRKTLIEDFKIPEEQIATQTSTVKELSEIELLDETCKIRYIITVSALKEGWDCPFAYVLCSLAELSSSVAVEQIVGRIIRQPYTENFINDNLNNSYAYIYSNNFYVTLNNLESAFVQNGFSSLEMDKLLKSLPKDNSKQLQFEIEETKNIIDDIHIENGAVTIKFSDAESEIDSLEKAIGVYNDKSKKLINEEPLLDEKEDQTIPNTTALKEEANDGLSKIKNDLISSNINAEIKQDEIQPSEEDKKGLKEPASVYSTEHKIAFNKNKNQLVIKEPISDDEIKGLLESIESPIFKEVLEKAINQFNQLAPAEKEMEFKVPLLAYKMKNLVCVEEEDLYTIFDAKYVTSRPWDIKKYSAKMDENEFSLKDKSSQTGKLDISEEGKAYTESVENQQDNQPLFIESADVWTVEDMILWLDMHLKNRDISQADSILFIQKVIKHLVNERKMELATLIRYKYRLKNALSKKIDKCRLDAKNQCYQLMLDEEEFRVDEKISFVYDPYDYPYNQLYKPGYNFKKHYYKEIGDMKSKGEEYICAQYIDNLEEVEFWVRNLSRRNKHSFWLQTATDRFYPDFVCKLKDGRILVVEYKGGDRWSDDDSKEKRQLGSIWAKKSEGKALFVMPKGDNLEEIAEIIRTGMK